MDTNRKIIDHYSQSLSADLEVNRGVAIINNMGHLQEISSIHPDPLHLSQVVVNVGGKIYIINADGLKELDGEPTNRGASVFIQLYGEGQGVFETQYQFHKGIIFKETLQIADQNFPTDEFEEIEDEVTMIDDYPRGIIQSSQDIWRD